MNSESNHSLLDLLGQPLDGPLVATTLRELEATRAPRTRGRTNLNFLARSRGVELKFRPALELGLESSSGGAPERLLASTLFFHGEGSEGFVGYAGTLPYGLKFEQSRAAVRELLGPPSASSSHYANDRWEFGALYLTLDFASDGARIQQVCVGLLPKLSS